MSGEASLKETQQFVRSLSPCGYGGDFSRSSWGMLDFLLGLTTPEMETGEMVNAYK